MPERVPPASTGPSEHQPLQSQSVDAPQTEWSAKTRASRRARARLLAIALVLVALAASYIVGSLLFRAAGYRQGYAAGLASVGYFEASAIADSMKAVACDTVLARAGLAPDSGRQGVWQVARFGLTPAKALCSYGGERALDTMRLPVFSEHEQAPVSRYFRSGNGHIHHVDR
jgi:hypothetical protein